MHSPSSRLLRIPTISSSVSTPDLQNLEKRYSLSKSNDETSSAPPNLVPSLKLGSVECITSPEMISSSAPGSLQSSPRKQNKDFVPAAATPEAVDRPRTLPPKNAAELQKHIKEYEEISKQIKKAMEKEAKEKMKRDNLKSCREKKLLEFRKVWTEEVIPQWEKKKDTKKVQDMWRVGLPPSVRGHVWKLSIGNELMITNDLYKISVLHAKQTKETMFGSPQLPDGANLPISPIHNKRMGGRGEIITNPVPMDELLGREGTVALVSLLDLPSDFPARELFTQDGPMYKQFADVLEAYVAYRPDVGYSPCMSYLVAGFLLNMETLDTFICLANFINKPFNLAFYITDRSQMYKYTIAADTIILTLLPKIHKHFKEVNIEPENYLVDWFMTLFLKSLPLDIASRVWDIYFLEGEIFLFKVALALLKTYSHQFESYPRDLCINMLNSFPKDISEDTLFENIALFNLDQKKFNKLLET